MTEQQLRDVLARVVPEAPDTVADPAPVVRVARRRRQVRVAGVGALAAVVIAGAAFGVTALRDHDDDQSLVADRPAFPAVYDVNPCPDPTADLPNGSVQDLDQVVMVRYCARDIGTGFPATQGPLDALVDDISVFAAGIRELAPADPSRCAAVDPIPTDSRLQLELADGSFVAIPAGLCQDADLEGRAIDGADATRIFLAALGSQRDEHSYAADDIAAPPDCMANGTSPAAPAREHLVAAVACTGSGVLKVVTLAADEVTRLDDAWQAATQGDTDCTTTLGDASSILARTERGDLVRLDAVGCHQFVYYAGADIQYLVTFEYTDNTRG